MLRIVEGAGALLLLSVFFAYLMAPAVAGVRRRVRFGPRQRPVSDARRSLSCMRSCLRPASCSGGCSAVR